jgi:protoporphyrinogen oxidase
MLHVDFCILGAGPSGLTFAHQVLRSGNSSFVVLEKEAEAGGLCRSDMVDGAPLDLGGGHFLDLRRSTVLDFLFQFMPRAEWKEHTRIARIRLRGSEVDHPLEANLWQLPQADQIDFLESIA